jgi:hypothetical protein
MKYAFAAVVLAAVARAQSLSDLPECAQPCIADSVESSTDCEVTDAACICSEDNFALIQGNALACVLDACGQEVATGEVLPASMALCEAAAGGDDAPETTAAPEETTAAPTATNGTTTSGPEPTGDAPDPGEGSAARFGSVGALVMLALGALAL